jgi:hypothetical protein
VLLLVIQGETSEGGSLTTRQYLGEGTGDEDGAAEEIGDGSSGRKRTRGDMCLRRGARMKVSWGKGVK